MTQNSLDQQILHHIQSTLVFGRVTRQGTDTHRFVVQDKVGLYLIALLFNGNMVFPTRTLTFDAFLVGVNTLLEKGKLLLPVVTPLVRGVVPTLKDS